MMKRPQGIYWVGVWMGIFGFMHSVGLRRLVALYSIQSGIPAIVMFAGLALLIWEIYGLIKLQPIQRWVGVIVFGWWAISSFIKIPYITSPPIPSERNAMIFKIILAIIGIINIVSIWYLVRPSFRKMCVQFVQEQKLQKNLLK
jgi:hypothetical protein